MQPASAGNVFLTGFMGAGKSTVGRLLAELLQRPFVDLDEVLIRRQGRPIATIFAAEGEDYFRSCETAVLHELPELPPAVYATGGGIVLREENRLVMRRLGCIVYLKCAWPILQERLLKSSGRPLVDAGQGMPEVKALWSARQAVYEQADLIVAVDGLTAMEVAQRLASELEARALS